MDLKSCQTKIQREGYRVVDNIAEIQKLNSDFIHSTLRAQALHDQKVILFKVISNRIDCFHELIHVFQNSDKLKNELSSHKRNELQDGYIKTMNLLINEIETMEKKKNVSAAKEMEGSIRPYIEFIKEWQLLNDWLQEKDVHYFIYQNCNALKCTNEDKEIALSNLYLLKKYFGDEKRKEIESNVSELIKPREKSAIDCAKKKWNKIKNQDLDLFFKMSWIDILKFLTNKKIKVFKFDDGYKIPQFKLYSIPIQDFKSLLDVGDRIPFDSKIRKGEALAKFICLGNDFAIIVTPNSTKGSLVHEYLHYEQALKNSEYCSALIATGSLAEQFKNGKISRIVYEKEALNANAIIWIAEYEVYRALSHNNKFLHTLEQTNNQELLKKYHDKVGELP